MSNAASRHGLKPSPTTIFEDNPRERNQYDKLKSQLFEQILPEGELELQTFERYAFATNQARRMRQMEIDAQDRWLNDPQQDSWFQQMERLQKLALLQERRADKALSELRKLQADRFSALDVHNELYLLGKRIEIPATLPVSQIRRQDQTRTSPAMIALMILANTPEVKQLMDQPIPPIIS